MINKTLITVLSLFILLTAAAQVPQGINYQAVARTSQGLIIPAQSITVRFSIIEGTIVGTSVYTETATTQTNSFGLFTLVIGKGTPVVGIFSAINWASGTDKFLKVEIDGTGGNNYQIQGTSQLMSVPFALYAEKTKLFSGNNTISVTNGNTITGNYQAGNNIVGNYQASDNTLLFNGNNVKANYQAGNGINITGNTIAGNYQAGTGINISGNTISSTGGSGGGQWITHSNGIYYPSGTTSGNVGIRSTPLSGIALIVNGDVPGVAEGNVATFTSSSNWHTQFSLENSASNSFYTFAVGGPGNTELKTKNFGIRNSNIQKWSLTVGGLTNFIGLGDQSIFPTIPKSMLHLKTGDIYIEQSINGVVLKSPNGGCFRVTVDNSGTLVTTNITCP